MRCMYGLNEIHTNSKIIGSIYYYGQFLEISVNFLLILNFRKIYNRSHDYFKYRVIFKNISLTHSAVKLQHSNG